MGTAAILEEGDLDINLTTEKEYPMNDGSVLKLRKTSQIIRYIRYNKDVDSENYYREQLMLFYPWRKEDCDLKGSHETYESSYREHAERIIANKMPYELDNGIINTIEENMDHFANGIDHVISAEIQHNEAIDFEQNENICADYGCFNPFAPWNKFRI